MDMTTSSPENITDPAREASQGVNVWGLVSVILFYLLILSIGVYASWKNKSLKSTKSEDIMLAKRDIGMGLGIFTMTATWVGGGYLNGTAEVVYSSGVVWAQAPVAYSFSIFMGGLFFAKKMRKAGYVTMLDPYDQRYGQTLAGILYLPALMGETFWSAAILSALGASLAVILRINHDVAIAISAAVAVLYTVIGGLYSVSLTDVVQLSCIGIGLSIGAGFAYNHPAVEPLPQTARQNPDWYPGPNVTWLGSVPNDPSCGVYIDGFLLLIFGGIPWQVYFQRVLSARTPQIAQILSLIAPFGCILLATPAAIIGAIARSTDWTQTAYSGEVPIPPRDYPLILPLVLEYLTPGPVAVIGLGAVSAAVMSSADSSVLSCSSMFSRNIYRPIRNAIFRKRPASDREIIWVMRISAVFFGGLSTLIAIKVKSIYGLFVLCSDFVYVILFPQLTCVLHLPFANSYGALCGLITGFFFRIAGGEPFLGIPGIICYPWCYEIDGMLYQNFPFKTLSMLITFVFIITGSYAAQLIFKKTNISKRFDVLGCFKETFDTDGNYVTTFEMKNCAETSA